MLTLWRWMRRRSDSAASGESELPASFNRERMTRYRIRAVKGLLAGRIAAHIESVLVHRLLQRIDLSPGNLDFGLADLAEELRTDEAGQQADDDHYDQQLQQRETA